MLDSYKIKLFLQNKKMKLGNKENHHHQRMTISISQLNNDVSLTESEWSPDQRRKTIINWRAVPFREKLNFIHKQLHSVVVTLLSRKTLNQAKLGKVLSLPLSLDEAMVLKVTNTFSYIMHLIRKNTSSTARKYLNQLTEEINRYEDMLHKKIEKEVEIFRKLEENERGSEDSSSFIEENMQNHSTNTMNNNTNSSKAAKTMTTFNILNTVNAMNSINTMNTMNNGNRKNSMNSINSKNGQNFYTSGGRRFKEEQLKATQVGSNRPIFFTRTTIE